MNLGYAMADFLIENNLVCVIGDINDDGKVDIEDLQMLRMQWLATDYVGVEDVTGGGSVDFEDFVSLAEIWCYGCCKFTRSLCRLFVLSNRVIISCPVGQNML